MEGLLHVIDMLGRTILELRMQLDTERAAKEALIKQVQELSERNQA